MAPFPPIHLPEPWSRPPEPVSKAPSTDANMDDDFVLRWLDSLPPSLSAGRCSAVSEPAVSAVPKPGHDAMSPSPLGSAASECSRRSAGWACRSSSGHCDVRAQHLADFAAMQLLKDCYTRQSIPTATRRRRSGSPAGHKEPSMPARCLISSLCADCRFCDAPAGQPGRTWRGRFDGPGGSSSEPPTESDSRILPTPASSTRSVRGSASADDRRALPYLRKHHFFGPSRRRTFPRALYATECSHLGDATDGDAQDDGEGEAPEMARTNSLGPESHGQGSVGRQVKDVVARKMQSLGRKLHQSGSAGALAEGAEVPDGRERRRQARQSVEGCSSSASNSPFRSPLLQAQRALERDSPSPEPGRCVAEPIAVQGMMIAAGELDRLTARTDRLHEVRTAAPVSSQSGAGGSTPARPDVPPNTPTSRGGKPVQSPAPSGPSPTAASSASDGSPPGLFMPVAQKGGTGHVSAPQALDDSQASPPTDQTGLGKQAPELKHSKSAPPKLGGSTRRSSESRTSHPAETPLPSTGPAAGRRRHSQPNRRVSFNEKQLTETELTRLTRLVDRALAEPARELESSGSSSTSTPPSGFGLDTLRPVRLRSPPPPPETADLLPGARPPRPPSRLGPLGARPTVTRTASSPGARRAGEFLELTETPDARRHSGPPQTLPPPAEAATSSGGGGGVVVVRDDIVLVDSEQGVLVRRSSSGTVHVLESIPSSGSPTDGGSGSSGSSGASSPIDAPA